MFTGGGAMQQQIAGGQISDIATGARTAPGSRVGRLRGVNWSYTLTSWLGLVPFLLFCLLFELLPALIIVFGSFSDSNSGALTLNNYQRMLSQAQNIHAFETSIALSFVTALIGAIFGFLASYGVYNLRTGALRNFIVGFSSIAANFAGVPLAFAFVATLGAEGFITVLIHNWFHVNLYDIGFSLYTFWGLVLVYTYFQLPLMILVTVPALSALRPEWREAATNLGASSFTYWRRIALPILMPSLIAAAMLLFANSFGAYATAYALAQGAINIVPILIGYAVAGNVNMDVGLGNALAVGMIVVLLIAVSLYTAMVRRANTWTGR
jgi:putative spermidine/putrescine transport system permease protein